MHHFFIWERNYKSSNVLHWNFKFFVSNRISFCCRRHSLVVLWIQIVCCTTFSYNTILKWYLHLRIGRRKGISGKSSYFCQTSTNCHLHHSCSPYMASITVKPTFMCVCLRVPHCFIFQVFLCVFGVSFSCLHLCNVLMEAIIIILGMLYKCRGKCCVSTLRKENIYTFETMLDRKLEMKFDTFYPRLIISNIIDVVVFVT